ncbi:unnamed protein product [Closterium sp. Naga37s-1]|nr:unnamed protein product [Closterium sp. Naga37s-1]
MADSTGPPVASLQLAKPRSMFLCGSLPVWLDREFTTLEFSPGISRSFFHDRTPGIPKVIPPPAQPSLDTHPPAWLHRDNILLPVDRPSDPPGSTWGGSYLHHSGARKCEALAVRGLAEFGEDAVDVIAPADVLKQLFKLPFSKASLFVSVHRVGRTLVLNPGSEPGCVDSHKVARTSRGQREAVLLFKLGVVRVCDHSSQQQQQQRRQQQQQQQQFGLQKAVVTDAACAGSLKNQIEGVQGEVKVEVEEEKEQEQEEGYARWEGAGKGKPCSKRERRLDNGSNGGAGRRIETGVGGGGGAGKRMETGGGGGGGVEAERGADGFARVVFWQLEHLRLFLGSDLILFSNEKHAAVSLHLVDVEHESSPLVWLDIWLDNLMAGVPELAICYHHKGVVQGYELLHCDDVFLLKCLARDGSASFYPHAVRDSALAILGFLQDKCVRSPGTYWLRKDAGTDVLQLFDLTPPLQNPSAPLRLAPSLATHPSPLGEPSGEAAGARAGRARGAAVGTAGEAAGGLAGRAGGNSPLSSLDPAVAAHLSLPLAMLLYRLALHLSDSHVPRDRHRTAQLFGYCLQLLHQKDHPVSPCILPSPRAVSAAPTTGGAAYERAVQRTSGRCSVRAGGAAYERAVQRRSGRCSVRAGGAAYERAVQRMSGRCSVRAGGAAYERAVQRTSGRCSVRAGGAAYERAVQRTSGRCSVRAGGAAYERAVQRMSGRCSV